MYIFGPLNFELHFGEKKLVLRPKKYKKKGNPQVFTQESSVPDFSTIG